MAQKITNKTTDLFVGTILKVINIKENTPFILNKFYKITDGDGVGALFVGGYSAVMVCCFIDLEKRSRTKS